MDECEKRYHREAFLLTSALTLVMGVVAGAIIWFVFRPILLISLSAGLVTTVLLDIFVSAVVEKRKIEYTPFFYKFFKTVIAIAWLAICLFWAVVYAEYFRVLQFKEGVPVWIQSHYKIILVIMVGFFLYIGIGYFVKNIRLWWRK